MHLFLVYLCATLAFAGDTLAPEVLRLAAARRQTAALLEQMPNYTCIETIERQESRSALEGLHRADLIRVEVAFLNGREVFALPGRRSFSNEELYRIIGHGFTATGLFATFARGVFLHSSAYRVTFGAAETLEGNPAFRYDYESNVGAESWNVRWAEQSGYVGERGSFWVDSRDLRLLRMTVSATAIPSNLPYSRILVSIDFSLTTLGGVPTLLPQAARVDAADFAGTEWVNRIDFSQCHRFDVETKLVIEDVPEEMVQKAFGTVLPPGMDIAVELRTPLAGGNASTSQPVEAVVFKAVNKGPVSLPAGSRLHGRIRRLVPLMPAGAGYLVSIEFDSIETPQGAIPFVATLAGVDRVRGVQVLKGSPQTGKDPRCKTAFGPELASEECGAAVPGVVNFLLSNDSVSLTPGLKMLWRTGGFEISGERGRK
jgi:hypothetical protein